MPVIKPEIEQVIAEIPQDTPVYYVLVKTWNRNVIHGPHHAMRAMDMAIENANSTCHQGRRGPVEFIQLTANLGRWRVVAGKKGTTKLEKRIRTGKVKD